MDKILIYEEIHFIYFY